MKKTLYALILLSILTWTTETAITIASEDQLPEITNLPDVLDI